MGRIVYLGGLAPNEELSPHLRSRVEVGEIFLVSGVPAVVLRAAVIIGSGSASFEMLRYLTERLPVMTTPRWVRTRTQPIAIRDVLRYLVAWASRRGGGQPLLRHRRPGRADLRGHDERLRRGRGPAPPRDHPGSDAQPRPVEPLGGAGHPRPRGAGPPAGGVAAQRGGLPRTRRRRLRRGSAGRPDRAEGGRRAGSATDQGGRGPHALVLGLDPGNAERSAADRPRWAGGSLYVDARARRVKRPRRHSGR